MKKKRIHVGKFRSSYFPTIHLYLLLDGDDDFFAFFFGGDARPLGVIFAFTAFLLEDTFEVEGWSEDEEAAVKVDGTLVARLESTIVVVATSLFLWKLKMKIGNYVRNWTLYVSK